MTFESQKRKFNKIENTNEEHLDDLNKKNQQIKIKNRQIKSLRSKDHTFKTIRSVGTPWQFAPNQTSILNLDPADSDPSSSFQSYDINMGKIHLRLVPYIFVEVLWSTVSGEQINAMPGAGVWEANNTIFELRDIEGQENSPIKEVILHTVLNFDSMRIGDVNDEVVFKLIAQLRVPTEIT